MIIDAGNNDDEDKVSAYLKQQGVTTLKYVIGTHPHEDHIGGLDEIIRDYSVDKILLPNYIVSTESFSDLLIAIQKKHLKITKPVVGATYALGDASFTIIAPNSQNYGDNANNYSIGIKLKYGKTTFVMVGDAEIESELDIIENRIDIHADVLKLSHHGSATSNSEMFLKAVDPKYAVISVGKDNKYGHPNINVLERLEENDVQIYRTDKQGTIIVTSDGTNISFYCEPSEITKEDLSDDLEKAEPVYITSSGAKYHLDGCQYLENGKVNISLEEAKESGYEPCSKCNPPK